MTGAMMLPKSNRLSVAGLSVRHECLFCQSTPSEGRGLSAVDNEPAGTWEAGVLHTEMRN